MEKDYGRGEHELTKNVSHSFKELITINIRVMILVKRTYIEHDNSIEKDDKRRKHELTRNASLLNTSRGSLQLISEL